MNTNVPAIVQPEDRAVLRVLVALGIAALGADEGSLLVLEPDKNLLTFAMVVRANEGESTPLEGQSIPVGKGLTGLAALTREVQIGAPTYVVGQELRQGSGPEAVIAAPMLIEDECVGVITAVSYQSGRRFSAKDAALYGQLSTVAAFVVQQRQQLATYKISAKRASTATNSLLYRDVIGSIDRLLQSSPAMLPAVLAILSALESTVAKDRP